jgi:hypothetical protein
MRRMREMSPVEPPGLVKIDASENGTLLYRNANGALLSRSKAWYRPPWDAESWHQRIWTIVGLPTCLRAQPADRAGTK